MYVTRPQCSFLNRTLGGEWLSLRKNAYHLLFYIFGQACYLNNFKEKGDTSAEELVTNACGLQAEVLANRKYWPSLTEAPNCLSLSPLLKHCSCFCVQQGFKTTRASGVNFPCNSVGKPFQLSPETHFRSQKRTWKP